MFRVSRIRVLVTIMTSNVGVLIVADGLTRGTIARRLAFFGRP
jgi:hypothetical protein